MLVGGKPLENAAVDRSVALRLRAEVQLTEDDDDLLREDVTYKRFPSRIYFAEGKLFQQDRVTVSTDYARWRNQQDLDIGRLSGNLRLPFGESRMSHLTLKFRKLENEGSDDVNYGYAGVGRSFGENLYTFVDYRHGSRGGETIGDQLSGYCSWKPTGRLRIGSQGAVNRAGQADGPEPWFVRVFATVFPVKDLTSIRVDAQRYDTDSALSYTEYNGYLYQKIGSRSFVRFNYRYYRDTGDRSSHAYGAKVQRYFSPRVASHIGYRIYDHQQGADFQTVFAGISLLL